MKLVFALPGFHRYERGAEIALLSLATRLAETGDDVTVIGSGEIRADAPYRFIRADSIRREKFEKFPFFPPMRSETVYEEASFAAGLLLKYSPADYDIAVTCSFPFTNMILRRTPLRGTRPLNVFVTQNGDWPAFSSASEYRLFGCDGLVCTNPDYLERNKDNWNCVLVPNGIDTARFQPGQSNRGIFDLPKRGTIVLMVSALIPTKRVLDGIRAVAMTEDASLVVAGDGPMRDEVSQLANTLLPDRFKRLSVEPHQMPQLYQSADVFLHMSKLESFGNVFPEAMACGLPIVGHDTDRLRWIVGNDEYLVDTENLNSVAAAIRLAAARPAQVGQGQLARAQKFSWDNIADQYRSFFRAMLEQRGQVEIR